MVTNTLPKTIHFHVRWRAALAVIWSQRLRVLLKMEKFTVRTGNRISFVLANEVDWIEAVGDYAGLHVGEKRPIAARVAK